MLSEAFSKQDISATGVREPTLLKLIFALLEKKSKTFLMGGARIG